MKETPSMLQYKKIKEQYKDCILFFRMGDFYETFADDAIITAKVLDIALTSRNRNEDKTPLAGIPHHALLTYLPRLIQAGYKVALCEQMEDPKKAKGIVKRDVVRIITPGTVLESEVQNPKKATYSLALYFSPKQKNPSIGIAFIDIGKGSFHVYASSDIKKIMEVIQNITPAEIILPESWIDLINTPDVYPSLFHLLAHFVISYVPGYDFENGLMTLQQHFHTHTLKGFVEEKYLDNGLKAGGALLKYIHDTQRSDALNIEKIEELRFQNTMYLDPSTIANLELFVPSSGSEGITLLDVIDKTQTSMGARFVRYSLLYPLIQKEEIQKRLDAVDTFIQTDRISSYTEILSHIADIERITARIGFMTITARDFVALKNSLLAALKLFDGLQDIDAALVKELLHDEHMTHHAREIANKINEMINDEVSLNSIDVIKEGVDKKLDELKHMLHSGKSWIREFQESEIKKTGINSLKVHYNKVFGYYIEVSNIHKHKVPDTYIRKQTLVNAERFITQDLKEKEDMIMNAQDMIVQIENNLFNAFKQSMLVYIPPLKKIAQNIAYIDMLLSFAAVAKERGYIKPIISEDIIKKPIHIENGRHPVIEQTLKNEPYIPNDVYLDCFSEQLLLITGPNMAGKSSILRMVALMSLLMQIGSFVPASFAELSIVDRIFSRVGARDNLALGESTFMVEMMETANILHNASNQSLIILDEIGRGTSTYDGVSIAYAVVEYVHEHIGAKTMFATHYHELIDMERIYKRIKNFNVMVKEEKNDIVFLRKLAKGGTDKSYGIHVAKIAGVPKEVLKRAQNVLKEYEKIKEEIKKADIPPLLSLIQDIGEEGTSDTVETEPVDTIIEKIKRIDINAMTPIEALQFLDSLYKEVHHD